MTGSGFAVWLTGLPASGKSSIARELAALLRSRGIAAVVLESDIFRTILTPQPVYTEEERDRFYEQLFLLGELITRAGVPVIFDATANKREYRDRARKAIGHFLEVYVATGLDVCRRRDPKGIYAKAAAAQAGSVPGVQAAYEHPLNPELTLNGESPAAANAAAIVSVLEQAHYI